MATFPTDDDCKRYLMGRRWPIGVTCPRCGNPALYKPNTRPFHWLCKPCKNYRFSVISGTIFENTNYPLRTWFEVLRSILNAKKGISAKQIEREIGSSYPTAWYLCHRLRAVMKDAEFTKLMGIVEVGEAGIGGKDKNRLAAPRGESIGASYLKGCPSNLGHPLLRESRCVSLTNS
jgi:transposase-like protein